MNVFGAITVIVATFAAILGALAADTWTPESYPVLRMVLIPTSGLLAGFIATKLYFALLSNRAAAHRSAEKSESLLGEGQVKRHESEEDRDEKY